MDYFLENILYSIYLGISWGTRRYLGISWGTRRYLGISWVTRRYLGVLGGT